MNREMVLLSEPLVAQRTGIGAMLFVDCLHVLLEVVLPLEPVGADGADVRLRPVGLLVDGRLVRRHQMGTKMMPLQKALITKMASKGLDLQFEFWQFVCGETFNSRILQLCRGFFKNLLLLEIFALSFTSVKTLCTVKYGR
jgi:hypothetical protein